MTTTKPPVVHLQFTDSGETCTTYSENLSVFVNGSLVASGYYGGEPEDNTRQRDYSWVEEALENLAVALGATVEVVEAPDES